MGKRKLKIAITGGIGSGKSVVSKVFENHGYKVISADRVAKDLMTNDRTLQNQITEVFGKDVYKNGKLDRQFLAAKVFSSKENTQRINSIVHPETIKVIEKQCADELQKKNLVFVESALIFEAKREKIFDYIITVTAPKQRRIEWVMERDGVEESKVVERMKNQLDEEKKINKSDFVLHNNSTLDELKIKSEFFLKVFEGFV